MPLPLVSFYVNSYNRLPLLRNLLNSFLVCNVYPNVEWIAVDYGSTDGSREFLREFADSAHFPMKLIIEDANRYPTIFGKFRNDARRMAEGDYFVEVPEDQQFITKRDWVSECLALFAHRKRLVGRNDLSCIVVYGYYRWRLNKPNNACYPEAQVDGTSYFLSKDKPYVDYHIMAREIFELIGPYLEPPEFGPDSPLWEEWKVGDPSLRPEQDYQIRCAGLGLKRALLKYPALVAFPNHCYPLPGPKEDGLLSPLWTLDEMKRRFGHLDRPVSSDELDPEHCGSESVQTLGWTTRVRQGLARIIKSRN
ncbi:MAG: glycosyltransferase [Dehalococcoidia bacterium]